MRSCFQSADILLPSYKVASDKWAVIACDQFTSEPEYWEEVNRIVGEAPSTLRLIYPEVYLSGETDGDRVARIHKSMREYCARGVLEREIKDGFVLVERETQSGKRLGLVGKVDLEAYDYHAGSSSPVRATEETILARIPPRMKVREQAPLELPHVMLLLDDPKGEVVEALYTQREGLETVYEAQLICGGGHIRGYAVTGERARQMNALLARKQAESGNLFLIVGDGNHSLATAKACWEKLKPTLSAQELAAHPARYALVEVVNLHSPAMVFEPINRVIFHADPGQLEGAFEEWLKERGIPFGAGEDITFAGGGFEKALGIGGRLPLEAFQRFADGYLEGHPSCLIDYIHGRENTLAVAERGNHCAVIFSPIQKDEIFTGIDKRGVFPRKTFSIGSANEKRYYMECRKITLE